MHLSLIFGELLVIFYLVIHPILLTIYEKQVKMRKIKSKLLHHFRGMGVQINNRDEVETKILQPYRTITKIM